MAGKRIHADAVAYKGPQDLRTQASQLEGNLNRVLSEAEALNVWKGGGGSSFQQLSAAWHTDAAKLKQILNEIADKMQTNQTHMQGQDAEQASSISKMHSRLGNVKSI